MRNRYFLLADAAASALAAYAAFALRFNWFFYPSRSEFLPFLVTATVVKPAVFYLFGLYARYWIYASVPDLIAVVVAVGASEIVVATLVMTALLFHRLEEFPRSALLMDGALTLLLVGGLRLSARIVAESRGSGGERKNTERRAVIAGAGQAGVMVAREALRNPQLRLRPVGFVDDDRKKHGKRILGIPVLGSTSDVAYIAQMRRADEVIIAMPTAPGQVVRAIAGSCVTAGIRSRTIPGIYELIDGRVDVRGLRNVDIADLLRRAQVTGSPQTAAFLSGRPVLVTGAGGSIGSELCRQVAQMRPSHLVLLGHGENSIFEAHAMLKRDFPDVPVQTVIADIRDASRLRRVFARHGPAVVFHAAAHKHVPLMEENPEEAITNNVVGTSNIVEAAIEFGTERLVLISSDKAVAPSSIMGASKRVAEMIVRSAARQSGRAFSVVRFGNVLGSRGSVVTLFKRQIEAGGPITVTHPDMTRFFMTIPEAVHLVLQAAGMSRSGELFVLDMGAPVRIADLARDLLRLYGFGEEEIPIIFTGMRPGEKLSESLLDEGETTQPTSHPDVLHVVERDGPPQNMRPQVAALAAVAATGERVEIETALAKCIPTFAPEWLRRSVSSTGAP